MCYGCEQAFCTKHFIEHRQDLSQQMDNIGQEYDIFKRDLSQQNMNQILFTQIDKWEKESIEKILNIDDIDETPAIAPRRGAADKNRVKFI